jgi:hypothetical protein
MYLAIAIVKDDEGTMTYKKTTESMDALELMSEFTDKFKLDDCDIDTIIVLENGSDIPQIVEILSRDNDDFDDVLDDDGELDDDWSDDE